MKKIELHVHSKEISPCGRLSVDEITTLYKDAGYDAIVLTNHFGPNVAEYHRLRGCTDFHKAYFDCIDEAVETGRKKGLLVLPGCELRFNINENDYLVYGMTPEQCRDFQAIFAMTPKEFSGFARENGILFYQAHPFRNGMTIVNPEYLFGVEVWNSHPRHDGRNEIAAAWAEKHHLHKIGGSDCHELPDVGTSAIVTDQPLETVSDLVNILKNDLYTIEKYGGAS